MICSPSNPTGACYTPDELQALAEVLKSHHEIMIISDEIYEYITFGQTHTGILQVAPELYEQTVLINGFSKGFAMTGWRLGYLAAPQQIAGAVAKIQSQETSAPSCISQKAGEAAYKNGLEAVHDMRDAFKKRRDFLVQELRSIDGVQCFTPKGAFYVFLMFLPILAKQHREIMKFQPAQIFACICLKNTGWQQFPAMHSASLKVFASATLHLWIR